LIQPKLELRVEAEDPQQRCDHFLAAKVDGLSRRQAKAFCQQGRVQRNGKVIAASASLALGDRICIAWPQTSQDDRDDSAPWSDSTPHWLHVGTEVSFVNKPSGWHSVALYPNQPQCLATWLNNQPQGDCRDPLQSGLLHRLDRETSGVMAVAMSANAWNVGRLAFSATKGGSKRYFALCGDGPPHSNLDAMLGTSGPWRILRAALGTGEKKERVSIRASNANLDAIPTTFARCLWQGESHLGRVHLWDLQLHGGFRHQLRVHLAAMGLPIVGDSIYAPAAIQCAPRMFLHAYALDLSVPFGASASVRHLPGEAFWAAVNDILGLERSTLGAHLFTIDET
jgi:23S rRNA-/tRNA-specific pseudouridylate synthase